MKKVILIILLLLLSLTIYSKEEEIDLNFKLTKGKKWTSKKSIGFMKSFKVQPQMAIWLEDFNGNMLETIYITQKTFDWNKSANGVVEKQFRKESLPYWSYKNKAGIDIKAGASHRNNLDFNVDTKIKTENQKFYIYLELNTSFDNNKYYTEKGENKTIKSGLNGQPSLIYRAEIDLTNNEMKTYNLELYKYSDPLGGKEIFDDFSKITTAKELIKTATLTIN